MRRARKLRGTATNATDWCDIPKRPYPTGLLEGEALERAIAKGKDRVRRAVLRGRRGTRTGALL